MKNKFGEEIEVNVSNYNLNSTDFSVYEKIINPFDLNTSFNYPYEDLEKNNCSFLEITIKGYLDECKILVILKSMYDFNEHIYYYVEPHYNYITDSYDCNLYFSLKKDNDLVLLGGSSIIILDIDNLEVKFYRELDEIDNCCLNISFADNIYTIKDEYDNEYYYDSKFNYLYKI